MADTSGPAGAAAAVDSAKKALKSADNFGQRETGNKKAGDVSAASTAAAPYRMAKPSSPKPEGHEPISMTSSSELRAADKSHDDNVKTLHEMQQQ